MIYGATRHICILNLASWPYRKLFIVITVVLEVKEKVHCFMMLTSSCSSCSEHSTNRV